MTIFVEKTTTPSLAIDFVEERIKLIKKEISDFPEFFDNIAIHKISRINCDIDRIAIIDKAKADEKNNTIFLDMEVTDLGEFWHYSYWADNSKGFKSNCFKETMGFIFGVIAYNNKHEKYNTYIKETSLKDNILFKSITDYKKISNPISIYDVVELVFNNHK